MSKVRISKIFNFEMAHVLKNYDGACKNIHGHSYKLTVTVSGEPLNNPTSPKNGMLIDFGILKSIVKTSVVDVYDHALVILKGHKEDFLSEEGMKNLKVIESDFQPTSENLITHFAEILIKELPTNVKLEKLHMHETAASFVEWYAADN